MNYVDPTGLWVQVGATIWEAQRGDTLWGLSEIVYGNGSLWTTFGYQDSHTNLQVGEIIDVTGWGRVGRNMGGYVDLYGGGQLYPIVDQMPTYTYTPPAPAPSKPSPPAANTPTQPTPSNPGNNASSSTSSPGNGGGGNKPSSKPNTGSGSNGKNEIYGPPVPVVPEYKPPITQPILPISPAPITGPVDGGPLSGIIHAGEAIADAIPGVDTAAIGGFFLDFDKIGETYHAKVDCWQAHFGYNDLYDFAFSLGTTMDKAKFDFKSGKKEYILWAWKGDYINLGAGAEMGIYERATFLGIKLPHWKVNKDLAMKMTLKLYYCGKKVVDYAPREKQWWITGFNPNYTVYSIAFLTAIYTVTFNTKKMYDDFYDAWGKNFRWTFEGNRTATLRF
ncbi:hypothetical protein IMSAG013_00248 [Clostridiales bacterium]|nr:hypothetical protein IMSAG013_00248 [Clostridiales bacterium]